MFLFKLGLLSRAFYAALTVLFGIGVWAIINYRGLGFVGGDQFWRMGVTFGAIFGLLWVISFITAWCIVYSGLKTSSPSVFK